MRGWDGTLLRIAKQFQNCIAQEQNQQNQDRQVEKSTGVPLAEPNFDFLDACSVL